MLIDAHCHLDFADFDADRDAVLSRARRAGVEQLVVAGTHRDAWQGTLELAEQTGLHACLGLHPVFLEHHRLDGEDDDISALGQALEAHPRCVALGECGIDARFGDTLDRQWHLFDAQLRLARDLRLPVVIHCVRANDDVAKRLAQFGLPAGGLIHAFAGSPEQARRFVDLGFTLGLGGAVTYPRARRVRRAVASLPDDAYVLETDSPDTPLSGHQGERNEPALVAEVCRHVAEIRGQAPQTVALHSSDNARRLLGLPPS